jgi:hypothetical protein
MPQTQNNKPKLSKILTNASLELLHGARELISNPIKVFSDVLTSPIQSLAKDYEARIEEEMKGQFPEWAKNCYTRDWSFESEADRISRIRSEAGRKGGLKTKTN